MLNMRYISRLIEKEVLRASRSFPALLMTGPRRSGKTTLLRKIFPQAAYSNQQAAKANPSQKRIIYIQLDIFIWLNTCAYDRTPVIIHKMEKVYE